MLSSALFSTEVTALETQVTQLQAQIIQAQERISRLGEAESMTAGAVDALRAAVGRISDLAPSAIATLRQTVLGLFGSDGHGGQPVSNGGPSPAPEPSAVMEVSDALSSDGTEQLVEVVIEPEQLYGQSCMWEHCPPESLQGQTVEIACHLTDAPLQGQFSEITCQTISNVVAVFEDKPTEQSPTMVEEAVGIAAEDSLFKLIEVSATTAYMRKEDGEICCAYVAANNKQNLRRWGEFLTVTHTCGTRFEVRESKRLTNAKYELKIWGLSLAQIEKLSTCDISRDPRKSLPDAPVRQPAKTPSDIELQDIGVGDTVRSVTVRHWEFRVVNINSDNFYVCERLGTSPVITQTLHPGSVELVSKAVSEEVAVESIQPLLHPPARIDENDVPDGVRLTLGRDDLLIQHEVWMQTEQRIMGQSKMQQRQIGTLIETKSGIEANRPRASVAKVFNRTWDAVSYLISGSGLKPLPTTKQPALVGAASTIDDDDF